MGKTSDLSDIERGMIVGARRAGSSISETAGLLGFSRVRVSRVYQEWCDKQKTSSQLQSCGWKQLVDERLGENHASSQVGHKQANNDVVQQRCENDISERTTRRSMSRMGYCSRRPHRVPLLSAKNKKTWVQLTHGHQHWTIKEWKNIAWSDKSQFLLRHADGRIRIWRKQHESMAHPTWCQR